MYSSQRTIFDHVKCYNLARFVLNTSLIVHPRLENLKGFVTYFAIPISLVLTSDCLFEEMKRIFVVSNQSNSCKSAINSRPFFTGKNCFKR